MDIKVAIDAVHEIAERYKLVPDGAEDARCPKCGFAFGWDGRECGHCHYAGVTPPKTDFLDHLYGLSTEVKAKAKAKKDEDDVFDKLYG